jgi:hypothetical protein
MPGSVAVGQLSLLLMAHFQPAWLTELFESLWVSTYRPLTRRGQLLTALAVQLQLGGLTFILGATVRLKQDSVKGQAFKQHPLLTRYAFVSLILALSAASIFASLSPSTVSCRSVFRRRSSSTSRILASRRGLTGQIVVGEHESQGMRFRYLRADHSLLGGLWIGPAKDALLASSGGSHLTEEELEIRGVETAESIYVSAIVETRNRGD